MVDEASVVNPWFVWTPVRSRLVKSGLVCRRLWSSWDIMLISETHFTNKKLLQITLLLSLPHKPSSRNRPRRKCHHHKKIYPALHPQQLQL
jgi:hypothetical protein